MALWVASSLWLFSVHLSVHYKGIPRYVCASGVAVQWDVDDYSSQQCV